MLQQVSGRTVLLDNRANAAGRRHQAGALFAAIDGLLSGSQLGSFSAPGWVVGAAPEADAPSATGGLRAHLDEGGDADDATNTAGVTVSANSRCELLSCILLWCGRCGRILTAVVGRMMTTVPQALTVLYTY